MSDYTPDEMAADLKVTRHWVVTHLDQLPHYRVGNLIRFTEADREAIRNLGRTQVKTDPNAPTARSRRTA